nr:PASTA domain-containing protein [uncultured Mucilaginibacter sp.]
MKKLLAYLKTSSFRKTALFAIGSVISVVLIAFFSLSYYTDHGSGVPVPQLTKLSIDRAIDILEQQGFNYYVDTIYAGDETPGTIVQQDPDAGTLVKKGRIIYLTMAALQAPPVAMPDIEQTQYIQAVATLANLGLKVGDTTYRSDIARDMVLEVKLNGQTIKSGTKIPKGSRLDLVLGDGNGAGELPIPEVVNLDLDEARVAIKGAGFTLGNITYQGAITDSSRLKVISQFPAPTDSASTTSIGSRINLTVTQGTGDGN